MKMKIHKNMGNLLLLCYQHVKFRKKCYGNYNKL